MAARKKPQTKAKRSIPSAAALAFGKGTAKGRGNGKKDRHRRNGNTRETGIVVNPTATKRFFTPLRLLLEDAILDEPYRQHSWTYAAIRALAMNIAGVPFRILTGDENNPTVIREGPWVDLFDTVNPIMQSRSQLWEAIVIWLSLSGECTIVKEGHGDEPIGPGEIPTEIWPMNGKAFEPVIDKSTKLPVGWFTIDPASNERVSFNLNQLVRVKYYNPYAPLRGLAPWMPASNSVRTDFKAVRFNEAYFDNDAMPGGFIKVDGAMTDDQKKDMRKGHEDRHQGQDKRRRIGILENGMEWVSAGDTLRDMEFVNLRNSSRQEILGIFKVPESELSLHANLNFATALSADRGFWTKTLVPIMRLIEDTLWVQLFGVSRPSILRSDVEKRRDRMMSWLPDWRGPQPDSIPFIPGVEDERPDSAGRRPGEVWGEFDLTAIEALRQNLDMKINTAQRMLQLGYPLNMINDRLELGMPEVPFGDIPFAPPGGIPIDQIILPPDEFEIDSHQQTPGGAPQPGPKPGVPSGEPTTPADQMDTEAEEGRGLEIVEEGGEWCVKDTDIEETVSCFPTKEAAEKAMAQMLRPVVAGDGAPPLLPIIEQKDLGLMSPDGERIIRKIDSQWCVFSKKGDRLGCHDTLQEAKDQLAAIETNKSRGKRQQPQPQIKRNPKKDSAWRTVLKTSMVPFEPRFRGRFRRYLKELRAVQIKRLLVGAKAKSAGEDVVEAVDNIPRGLETVKLNQRVPSPFDPGDASRLAFDLDRAAQRVKTMHHPIYLQVTENSMAQTFNELGGNFAFDVTDPRVVDVITEREAILAKVPENIQKSLARSLESGIANGESIRELADRIRVEFNRIGGARSFTIARTEVASTTNTSRFTVMGGEGVDRHEWITARDEVVRQTHRDQDGDKRNLGEPFPNGLIHPNDPTGPAGEVINCRCIAIAV